MVGRFLLEGSIGAVSSLGGMVLRSAEERPWAILVSGRGLVANPSSKGAAL
jgi:hypothetical protein